MSDNNTPRAMSNSVYVEGNTRFVETRPAGEHTVTSFSLDNVDKRGFHNYFKVEMWNATQDVLEILGRDEAVLVQGSLKVNQWESTDKDTGAVKKNKVVLINAFKIVDAESNRKSRSGANASEAPAAKTVERTTGATNNSGLGGDDPFSSGDPFQ